MSRLGGGLKCLLPSWFLAPTQGLAYFWVSVRLGFDVDRDLALQASGLGYRGLPPQLAGGF